jgi:hypothetical protein
MKSYSALTPAQVDDFFESVIVLLFVLLPCFAMGVVTDKDQISLQKNPLRQTFHPLKLWFNTPITGMFYLIVLLLGLIVTVHFCSGVPFQKLYLSAGMLFAWVLPWLFLFAALRLLGFKQRGILQIYLLMTVLYVILCGFRAGRGSPRDFLFFPSGILGFGCLSVLLYVVAWIRSKRLAVVSP